MEHLVSPSLLAADFANLQRDVEMVNDSVADWLHLDIMDGVFVPNISFGFPILDAIEPHLKKPMDVHLMIVRPEQYVDRFKQAGADVLTVHYEACPHLHRTVQQIKGAGMKAGVALNPHTPVYVLEDIVAELDLVLIMTVNPGFGGQKFIEHSYLKVRRLHKMIEEQKASTLIEVDGGVDMSNARGLIDAGVDVLVAGSSVFRANDPKEAILALKGC